MMPHRISNEPFAPDDAEVVNVTHPEEFHRFVEGLRFLGMNDVQLEKLLRDYPAFLEAYEQFQDCQKD